MLCSSAACSRLRSWLRDYDMIQSVAVFLIYIQIGCALVGSIGALYNGVLLVNLAILLFALVAVESSSQRLARTYAVLLVCAIFLDVSWFVLFFREIWNMSTEKYGAFDYFSLKVSLWMETIGFIVRFLSSFIWIQMYRLGASSVNNGYHEADLRISFLDCENYPVIMQNSDNCEALGGSIYNPTYFSSRFEDVQDGESQGSSKQRAGDDGGSTSASESPQPKLIDRSSRVTLVSANSKQGSNASHDHGDAWNLWIKESLHVFVRWFLFRSFTGQLSKLVFLDIFALVLYLGTFISPNFLHRVYYKLLWPSRRKQNAEFKFLFSVSSFRSSTFLRL